MENEKSVRHMKLLQMQALPLEEKIRATQRRIEEWLAAFPNAKVSFSGGKDSTVLLHIARTVKKDIGGVFSNTGLEYPEIVEFVKTLDNIEIVRPKHSFLEVIQKHGYPVVSKRMAQYIGEVQRTKSDYLKSLRLTGIGRDGKLHNVSKISQKWQWLCESGIPVSHKCCHFLKKKPLDDVGVSPIVGTMASDSDQRKEMFYKHSCNAFDLSRPRSAPMSFWLESDVWEYLKSKDIPYSRIYDMGYTRTGCIFCLFGLHLEKRPNRFDLMQKTHPQLFKYCMDGPLNLRPIIKRVYGIEY